MQKTTCCQRRWEEHGLDTDKLILEDEALKVIIEKYTREAGVRWLKKQLASIARFVSEKIVSGNADLPYVVKADMLNDDPRKRGDPAGRGTERTCTRCSHRDLHGHRSEGIFSSSNVPSCREPESLR